MLKREDTLALTCSLMYLYGSSMLSILITDSFLTSTPDPITGKKQVPERKNNIQHGIDAMRIQEWWHDKFKSCIRNPKTSESY